ncbi:serine/threonine protein kinase [Bacillus sp. MRMR6]|uniref:serine/threonine protein kinase n=1 Tax=Bacillus sp. MRMR6 TaxID=1928617 RepID=UPI0009518367|nr:serine/threonine protein kinase [Bacillus sp. MRMR6]OLS37224.1 serine/threonine protein kinase [Bacillus sp. MRMR6]
MLIVHELLSKIRITSNSNNKLVTIHGSLEDLRCVGIGTDAAVFQYIHNPAYAFKLYADDKKEKVQIEAKVYQKLKGSLFFPICYAVSDRYLVLSFESGITLYDCLLQGIKIPYTVIQEVEEAQRYARASGLNPRDIHLKNVLLQNGKAKVIDVSEYLRQGNDFRWEHLKKAYKEFYHIFEGRTVPYWLLEMIRRWYNKKQYDSIEKFLKFSSDIKIFSRKKRTGKVLPKK